MWNSSFQIPPLWVWKWDIFHRLWEVASPPHPNFSTVPQRSMVLFSPSLHSLLSPQFSWTSRSPTITHSWRTSVSSTPTAYDLLLKIRLFLPIISDPISLALHYKAWKLCPSASVQHCVGGNRLDIYRKLTVFSTSMYRLCLQVVSRYHFIAFFSSHYGPTPQLNMSNYGQGTASTAKEKIQSEFFERCNKWYVFSSASTPPNPPTAMRWWRNGKEAPGFM